MTTLFPSDPYDGVAVFDAPLVYLAAVEATNYPLAEMPALMDATFPAIFAALDAAGTEMCGPALALHRRIPTDTADLAVGMPITHPLAEVLPLPTGRDVTGVTCPIGAVAATSYFGPYDGLGDAWGRFMGDVAASGHRPSPTFLEIYVSNPIETPDPSALRTDLVVFLS